MTSASFRTLKSVHAIRSSLRQLAFLGKTDERCKMWVRTKTPGLTKRCGKPARDQIGGVWYCGVHAPKAQRQLEQETPRAGEQP